MIVIISAGAGAQGLIVNELSSFGSNIFGVVPGAAADDGPPASIMGITVTTLKLEEVEDLKKIPHVLAVTGYARGVDTITYQNQKVDGTFLGVNAEFIEVEPGDVIQGRFFAVDDVKSSSRVVVLGSQIKQELFDHLIVASIQFIDTGIGTSKNDSGLLSMIRTTACSEGNSDHLSRRVDYGESTNDDYNTNIQIRELNAINAAMAVIKWKKMIGFYQDTKQEYHSVYTTSGNFIVNDETRS